MGEKREKDIWLENIERKYHEDVIQFVGMIVAFQDVLPAVALVRAQEIASKLKEYRIKNDYLEGYKRP